MSSSTMELAWAVGLMSLIARQEVWNGWAGTRSHHPSQQLMPFLWGFIAVALTGQWHPAVIPAGILMLLLFLILGMDHRARH